MYSAEPEKDSQKNRLHILFIAAATIPAILIGLYCLVSGSFIVFQNLFYIPIILSCMYYTTRGFIYSVCLAVLYMMLILFFTSETGIIMQALVRAALFIAIAGVVTLLSIRHKEAERRQHLTVEILSILNDPSALTDAISRILTAIKRETGFEAVGIRLRSGDDFPYFVQEGFSNDFLLTENSLAVRSGDGSPCRDENGNYSLECTCGLVISGQTDPANPLFTQGGSCWTNNSFPLLNLPIDQDPRLHPRNRCIHEGFLSVALVPIRTNQEIIGLLQLNDRKKDRFTLDMIRFYEEISTSIGVALMRKQLEEERERLILELRKALSHVKTLSGLLPICASCKKIRNDKGYWEQIEVYIRDRSEADFSHGICPECTAKLYPEYYKKINIDE